MKKPNLIEQLSETLSFEMIFVEGGFFMMGSVDKEVLSEEQPVHKVTVSDFYIGEYPVTQELWEAVMDDNPSKFKGYNRPVEMVSWHDTQNFIEKLKESTSKPYRLLTEAEWEYGARGGQKSQKYKFAGSNKLKDIGWYQKNSHGESKPVGLKYPNELGLYDMSGNVYEWVEDQWHDDYNGAPADGSAWKDLEEGANHVVRGGSWFNMAQGCRCSYRFSYGPTGRDGDLGFRLGLFL